MLLGRRPSFPFPAGAGWTELAEEIDKLLDGFRLLRPLLMPPASQSGFGKNRKLCGDCRSRLRKVQASTERVRLLEIGGTALRLQTMKLTRDARAPSLKSGQRAGQIPPPAGGLRLQSRCW